MDDTVNKIIIRMFRNQKWWEDTTIHDDLRFHTAGCIQQAATVEKRNIALTSDVIKYIEKLVRDLIVSSLPDTLDPLQFTPCPNRSTKDEIPHSLHTPYTHHTLSHQDKRKRNYVKMLFIDYSSEFNTTIPFKLTTK